MPKRARPSTKQKKKRQQQKPKDITRFGLPSLRQGEGEAVLKAKLPEMTVSLDANSFWMAWEVLEARRVQYERYKDGPLQHVYDAYTELIRAFRRSYYITHPERRAEMEALEAAQRARQEKEKKDAAEKAQRAAERKSAANPAKKKDGTKRKRCREVYDANPKYRCVGPANHKSPKHKDRYGHRWVTDE